MGPAQSPILFLPSGVACLALSLAMLSASANAEPPSQRHDWQLGIDVGYVAATTDLGAWTEGGLGKLRYDRRGDGFNAVRAYAQYRGQIAETLWGHVILDYVDDASGGLDVSEAYLTWRPLPKSRNQHQLRVGAFYPPLSLENTSAGWASPYTLSYSAINTWLGEEVRPIGAEWSLRRHLGAAGSPHELGAFAAAFYGNDPAGTLLFWRGWSLHDRQSRLGDKLSIPPAPVWDASGNIVATREQTLEPFHEIDHRAGLYAGVEWRYSKRVLVQFARFDNKADPYTFSDGEWSWRTYFDHLAAQISLPARLGLIAQWMNGETGWLTGAGPDGVISPAAAFAEDTFDAKFLLLTRAFGDRHRLSMRYDEFMIVRAEDPPALRSDSGHAWTLAYRYEPSQRGLRIVAEWLQIDSQRELWPAFYGAAPRATERELRLQIGVDLAATRAL
jgi:hypothetical protein